MGAPKLATELDDAIAHSAAPANVRLALDRLAAVHADLMARLADDSRLAAAVVAVTAASRSLTRLLETDPTALEVLAELDRVRRPSPDTAAELVAWKRLDLLRVAARDLLGMDELEATGAALADQAAAVFAAACRLTDAVGVAVIGMGKLGGRELNYASDVDVMFVGQDGHIARAVVDVARRCFRVDLNLRPEGRNGALVRTVESFEAYWQRWAQPWEFQALLKARPIAGDPDLGGRFAEAAARHLWGRRFSADDIRSVRSMKARAEAEVTRRGLGEREIKLGPGGIRDIEFSVQLLQLVHGGPDEELRSPTTLDALSELADAGFVGRHDAEHLADAYRYLRRVEHRLQLEDEQQVHTLPMDARALDWLARVVGYQPSPTASPAQQLDAELRRHQAEVRAIHERIYFRPLLEAFAHHDGMVMTAEAAEARLAAFGFTDAQRTRQAVAELTRGLTRSSRMMQQLLPLLLDWLSDSPDPDLGLLGLRNLASGPQRSMELANAFRDSPEVARRLCRLLGTSRLLAASLHHNPDLISSLARPDDLRLRSRAELVEGALAASTWRSGTAERQAALKRFTDREGLRIAAHDVLDLIEVTDVGPALTNLAEAALEAATAAVAPPVPFGIVAMGRLGGGELSYPSDLDVLFVYEGTTSADFEAAERTATALLRFLSSATPVIYDVDPGLRPEGKQGPLARSVDAFRSYFERWAQPWERLAMVRARPAAGDLALGARLLETVEPYVWGDGLTEDHRREIRRIKARVERERIPASEDPQFHLKLGRGSLSDVEFCTQLLQLEQGVRSPSTLEALAGLAAAGYVAPDDRAVLAEAYRFCERTRNRLFLVNSSRGDSLPQHPERLARLARSLGSTPGELRGEYRRVTRRARRVVERLFYGHQG
ncbi:MAG: bifunctional [glutamine synthetase] adenylyltransferase/[glutamine synthetase]-adenylyl-L-tyrosine phosphorylase [Acidimicrobiales bacterium]